MMKWDGSAWAQAGNKALHLSFYTGVDQAETGTTDLIKAGRNVADDADVAFLSDKARLATDADPIENTDISHKKYVDDKTAPLNFLFGDWTKQDSDSVDIARSTIYLVTSDGIITVFATPAADNSLAIKTDASPTPTITRLTIEAAEISTPVCLTCPIKNGEYFQIVCGVTVTASWLPFGSGECEPQ
jgi:hypothetical protein